MYYGKLVYCVIFSQMVWYLSNMIFHKIWFPSYYVMLIYCRYPTIYWKQAGKEDKPEAYDVSHINGSIIIVLMLQCKLRNIGFVVKP